MIISDMEQASRTSNSTRLITLRHVVDTASAAIFDKKLVTNVFRGHLVEAILSLAISPEWTWMSEDYASWDFQNAKGVRLEVKQSALKQSWSKEDASPSKPSFDIAPRVIHWIDGKAENANTRAANIYVFALHATTDASADHRDPGQWQFMVVPTHRLPDTKRISYGKLLKLASPIGISQILQKLEEETNVLVHMQGFAPLQS